MQQVTSARVLSASDRVQTTVATQFIEVACADTVYFAQGNYVNHPIITLNSWNYVSVR